MPQYALIAEHVRNVNPDLLVRDDSCEVCYGVLRCSERNVSRRAPQAPRTTGDNLAFGEADRSGCRGPSGSQRSRATEQDCSANVPNGYSVSRHRRGFGGRQSLTNRPRYSRLGCGDRIRLRFWRIVFTSSADFPKTAGRQTDLNSRTFIPRGFFPSSGAAANWINTAGKEGKNHMHLIRKATPLFIVASGLAWLTVSPPTEAVVPPLPFAAAVKSSLHNIPEQFSALF